MEHSDKWTFTDYFRAEKEIFRAVISTGVAARWMIEHDFEMPTDADLKKMVAEVNRELCKVWVDIYVSALLKWLDGQ